MTGLWSKQNLLHALDQTHAEVKAIDEFVSGEEIVALRGEIQKENWESKAAPIVQIEANQVGRDAVKITVAAGYSVVVGVDRLVLVNDEFDRNYQFVAAKNLTLNHCCQIVDVYDYFEGGLFGDSQIVGLKLLKDVLQTQITTPDNTFVVCNNIVV